MSTGKFFFGIVLVLCLARGVDHFLLHDRGWSMLIGQGAPKSLMAGTFKAKRQEKVDRLTKEERYKSREALLRQLYSSANEEIVVLRDGRKFEGAKTAEDEKTVTFRQLFGKSGALESKIAKSDILEIKPLTRGAATITDDEVLINKTFPDFNFTRTGEYSFFSDEDYFRARDVASLLLGLRDGVAKVFDPVIEKDADRRIYVLVFGDGEKFYALCNAVAPYLRGAVGFYSPEANYLVVYDFFNGKFFREFNSELRKVQKDLKQEDAATLQSVQSRFALDLKAENISVVRHEGSHQLSFDYGIFKDDVSDTWAVEGFAEYCSTPYVGKLRQEQVDHVAQAINDKQYIPLDRLFGLSERAAFYRQSGYMTALSYAESWAYFYYLMQPQYRLKFFDYLNAVKQQKVKDAKARTELFSRTMGISTEALDKQVKDFILHNTRVKIKEDNG